MYIIYYPIHQFYYKHIWLLQKDRQCPIRHHNEHILKDYDRLVYLDVYLVHSHYLQYYQQ
ncbi:hypothetical protein BCAH1134_C0685 (plasmid) [Bacillus cereus AH1134]|nr:hypothetical protein BCAH1134_C0685 [Bacillus cereus AH1134]